VRENWTDWWSGGMGKECVRIGQIGGLEVEEVTGDLENRVSSVFVICATPQTLF
jgi:hypothetical protein